MNNNNTNIGKLLIYISLGLMIIVLFCPIFTGVESGLFGQSRGCLEITGLYVKGGDVGDAQAQPIPMILSVIWIAFSFMFMQAKNIVGIVLSCIMSGASIICLLLLLGMQVLVANAPSNVYTNFEIGYYLLCLLFLLSTIGFAKNAKYLKNQRNRING